MYVCYHPNTFPKPFLSVMWNPDRFLKNLVLRSYFFCEFAVHTIFGKNCFGCFRACVFKFFCIYWIKGYSIRYIPRHNIRCDELIQTNLWTRTAVELLLECLLLYDATSFKKCITFPTLQMVRLRQNHGNFLHKFVPILIQFLHKFAPLIQFSIQ